MPVDMAASGPLVPIEGIRLNSVAAGISKSGRRDLTLIECVAGTRVAAVFTRNRFQAAPVVVAKRHLSSGAPRALLINSSNANAGTGVGGIEDAIAVAARAAEQLGVAKEQVLPFSTGVIGVRLPLESMLAAVPRVVSGLTERGWEDAARAIMTTDTAPKGVSAQVELEGRGITITGIAKGAGMIHPNMATMLAFIATDARISDDALRSALAWACDMSFNRITVDGDTSTNDACVLLATGQAPNPEIEKAEGEHFDAFVEALSSVAVHLAQAIVRDGEGATKFVTIRVCGATTPAQARTVGSTVAHSPLVKTALFAGDANWGRILAAVGRAPIPALDISAVSLSINGVRIFHRGEVDGEYSERAGQAAMAERDIELLIDLGQGDVEDWLWTTDLSHEYVRINAEYRT